MFERILVPVDGSGLAERAVPSAIALARGLKCPVHLIQAITLPQTLGLEPVVNAEVWQQIIDGSTTAATEYLERLQHRFGAAGVPATREVPIGDPALQIMAQASGPIATLVVMGTHGHARLARRAAGRW